MFIGLPAVKTAAVHDCRKLQLTLTYVEATPMGRCTALLVTASLGVAAMGCGDGKGSTPTAPEFAPSTVTCDLSTARSLVSSIFPNSVKTAVTNSLQAIQNAGAKTEAATNAGFDILALLATYGPGSPQSGSTFANAIIGCQDVGAVSLPIDFTGALGPNGAFEVRGGSSTDVAANVSHDGAWGLEPPLNIDVTPATRYTWDQITVAPTRFPPASNSSNKRFLAYGALITDPNFTAEQQVGTIFDWFTLPTLTFVPGVVVGTCITNGESQLLIQHNPQANGGKIVPSATPSFCPTTASFNSSVTGWSPFALARRAIDFFRPQPLLAAVLTAKPPSGSIGALSPSAAVDPKTITVSFPANAVVADGKTNLLIRFTNGNPVSVNVTPTGGTKMDGVLVKLTAVNNLGSTVTTTGDVVATQDGIATFSGFTISKAGGYRLVVTLVGFGQNGTAGFQFNSITSNGFNLKQSK